MAKKAVGRSFGPTGALFPDDQDVRGLTKAIFKASKSKDAPENEFSNITPSRSSGNSQPKRNTPIPQAGWAGGNAIVTKKDINKPSSDSHTISETTASNISLQNSASPSTMQNRPLIDNTSNAIKYSTPNNIPTANALSGNFHKYEKNAENTNLSNGLGATSDRTAMGGIELGYDESPASSSGGTVENHGDNENGNQNSSNSRNRQDGNTNSNNNSSTNPDKINIFKDKYPHCIVWTPIHVLTWILPFVGHMGICDENGEIFEFMGMGVTCGNGLSFGPVTRYIQLPLKGVKKQTWNEGLRRGCQMSHGRIHGGFFNNCHTFAADSLNTMKYKNFSCWNQFILIPWVFIFGRYTSWKLFIYHWVPPILLYLIIYWFIGHALPSMTAASGGEGIR